jgi:hypothetical protein
MMRICKAERSLRGCDIAKGHEGYYTMAQLMFAVIDIHHENIPVDVQLAGVCKDLNVALKIAMYVCKRDSGAWGVQVIQTKFVENQPIDYFFTFTNTRLITDDEISSILLEHPELIGNENLMKQYKNIHIECFDCDSLNNKQ